MKTITTSGTLTALNDSSVPPMRIEGDPLICAQLFIRQMIPPHLVNEYSTYNFQAKVYHRTSENFFHQMAVDALHEPEAINAVHITFTLADLQDRLARDFARVMQFDDAVILGKFQLTLDAPPVLRGEPLMTSERKSPPISGVDIRRIMRKHNEFQDMALSHLTAGSPTRGLNDSFMTRCALIGLRDAINEVLEKK